MFNQNNIKTQSAILIAFAFVLRLLFVNYFLVHNIQNAEGNKSLSSHFSHASMHHKSAVTSKRETYASAVEPCEENSENERDLIKAYSPILLLLFSFLFNPISTLSRSVNLFDSYICRFNSKKYLALSVIRI